MMLLSDILTVLGNSDEHQLIQLFPETSPPRHLRPARALLLAAGPGVPPHGLRGRPGRAGQHQDL